MGWLLCFCISSMFPSSIQEGFRPQSGCPQRYDAAPVLQWLLTSSTWTHEWYAGLDLAPTCPEVYMICVENKTTSKDKNSLTAFRSPSIVVTSWFSSSTDRAKPALPLIEEVWKTERTIELLNRSWLKINRDVESITQENQTLQTPVSVRF
jgi:hypothetical protein